MDPEYSAEFRQRAARLYVGTYLRGNERDPYGCYYGLYLWVCVMRTAPASTLLLDEMWRRRYWPHDPMSARGQLLIANSIAAFFQQPAYTPWLDDEVRWYHREVLLEQSSTVLAAVLQRAVQSRPGSFGALSRVSRRFYAAMRPYRPAVRQHVRAHLTASPSLIRTVAIDAIDRLLRNGPGWRVYLGVSSASLCETWRIMLAVASSTEYTLAVTCQRIRSPPGTVLIPPAAVLSTRVLWSMAAVSGQAAEVSTTEALARWVHAYFLQPKSTLLSRVASAREYLRRVLADHPTASIILALPESLREFPTGDAVLTALHSMLGVRTSIDAKSRNLTLALPLAEICALAPTQREERAERLFDQLVPAE